jgi:signal transduction histidine kinase
MLSSIPYGFKNPELDFREKLNPEIKRNVYLMYKEILNNIIKHSRAKHVDINIEKEQKNLTIKINDNGVGFDEATVQDGNGLRNLRNRSAKIGADLIVQSSLGAGTTVIIKVIIT